MSHDPGSDDWPPYAGVAQELKHHRKTFFETQELVVIVIGHG